MKAFICELCGSNDIIKQDGLFVCQHCGTKYSLEEAKKLLGTVQIDRTEEIKNAIIVGMRAYQNNDFINAAKYFESVMLADANDWRAFIYHATSNFCCIALERIPDAAEVYKQSISSALLMMTNTGTNKDAIFEVYQCILNSIWFLVRRLDSNSSFREAFLQAQSYTYLYRIFNYFENRLLEYNADLSLLIQVKKSKVQYLEINRDKLPNEADHLISSLTKEIQMYDKDYKATKKKFLWFG